MKKILAIISLVFISACSHDVEVVEVIKGENGKDGKDGISGLGIKEYIYPCGKTLDIENQEVLIRLTDGNILALYDGGAKLDRLVLINPGNYITTDTNGKKQCSFTVTDDLKIINQELCDSSGPITVCTPCTSSSPVCTPIGGA